MLPRHGFVGVCWLIFSYVSIGFCHVINFIVSFACLLKIKVVPVIWLHYVSRNNYLQLQMFLQIAFIVKFSLFLVYFILF